MVRSIRESRMTEDFYDLLEVPRDAPEEEIRDAFREKVRIYHPDRNDDERAQAQFTALKKAYDILGDPVERRAYDRLGHEEYVRKRTSGLPSPDVWASQTDDKPDPSSVSLGRSGGRGSQRRRGRSRAASSGGRSAEATPNPGDSDDGFGAGGLATRIRDLVTGRVRRPPDWVRRSDVLRAIRDSSALHGIRLRLPPTRLLWLSTVVYLIGLLQYAVTFRESLGTTFDALLSADGIEPLWDVLTGDRHGLATVGSFVLEFQAVTPPVSRGLWLGLLAAAIAGTLVVLAGARWLWRTEPMGPVRLEETIVVSVVLGVVATLAGGPVLAGAVLMPVLFGVIVHRTRSSMGWSPSYAYVGAVSLPLIALVLEALSVIDPTLAFDLVAYVLVPLLGGLGLPARVLLRRR